MTSDRRRTANRANAQKSTGPRTAAAKEAASCNATKHGLASAVPDPTTLAAIEALAASLAGEGASPEVVRHAREAAEADFDLRRARLTMAGCLTDLTRASRSPTGDALRERWRALSGFDRYLARAHSRRRMALKALAASQSAATVAGVPAPPLA